MNILWFGIACQGRSPLVMDRYAVGTASKILTESAAKKIDLSNPREIATRSLWLADDDETVIIPRDTLHRAIVEAGKFHKYGKGRKLWTTSDSSILPGIMEWGDAEAFKLNFPVWEVDIRGARVASGQRQDKFRPIFPEWGFDFEIGIDGDEIHPSVFRDIVDTAGRRIGIGSMRPERKGLYGQFRVTAWEEIEKPSDGESPLKMKSLMADLAKLSKPKKEKKAA